MALHLLHGTFHITICEAANLPKHRAGFLHRIVGLGGSQQLYATIDMERARVGRTRVINHEATNPSWNESFHIYCAYHVAHVVVSIKDDNAVGAAVVGRAKIPVEDILGGEEIDQSFGLVKDDGEIVEDATIHIRMQYFDICKFPWWGKGVRGSKFPGVPYTFFRQWKGCKVTLYQDAHIPNDFAPKIYLSGGRVYEQNRCWEDIFHAISNARHFIYITGWSVYTQIELVRDMDRPIPGSQGVLLGDLLKKKAEEGVRVNLLVWDDRTSIDILRKDGLMGTHDEDTENYFQGSDVNCVLCPRDPDDGLSTIQSIQIKTMFTHHQKTVIVDAPLPGEGGGDTRRVLSFVGGLDLCDGRYDTPYHSLFRTLNTTHKDDFHQPNFEAGATINRGGPREPWHDIHAKIEGQAAWDVLHNFEQRWRKQGREDKLIVIQEVGDLDPPAPVMYENDPETWNVQVFRSIDGGAVSGFPDVPEEAAKAGLVSGKDSIIDRSIQDAYIHAIRRARNFIYIENQYFLGSCASWDADRDAGCLHLVPIELALKIASKIEADERFSAIVVVPMWPEGVPESGSVRAILHWMRQTMSMMYKIIAEALQAKGRYDESPKDYLSFFCLGNREGRLGGEYLAPDAPPEDSNYKKAQDNRRFMIYVHSKMMIVDDEYIIVGSANINQRSMDGGKDTEIAIGAFQPYHTTAHGVPRSQIHGFRMSLWYEHTGRLDDTYLNPSSVACMHKLNSIGDELWDAFVGDEPCDLEGHLLTFPIIVTNEGHVQEIPGRSHFPDTQAPILGEKSDVLPPILTS